MCTGWGVKSWGWIMKGREWAEGQMQRGIDAIIVLFHLYQKPAVVVIERGWEWRTLSPFIRHTDFREQRICPCRCHTSIQRDHVMIFCPGKLAEIFLLTVRCAFKLTFNVPGSRMECLLDAWVLCISLIGLSSTDGGELRKGWDTLVGA